MDDFITILVGIAILGGGTYAMRLGGVKLGNRLALSEKSSALLSDAATTLLVSVALATTFYSSGHFAGFSRILGVFVGVILAWRKKSMILVIIASAVVTSFMRYIGIP
ncbi:AzlD domain-containing protein [Pantoea sp. App145]|uniref:AzlD domain-containing protein n=1 Tax=Pantoea sp. App145 TaxID=3071567 RepID=UPI003A80EF1B